MPAAPNPPGQTPLRRMAEAMLLAGQAPAARTWATGAAALALLHDMAGRRETADDALKLLHELQVHQVELDLQHEQMEQERRELAEEHDLYAELFEFAPEAYLRVDVRGRIAAANLAGGRLFGVEPSALLGRSVGELLEAGSLATLQHLLEGLAASGPARTAELVLAGGGGTPRSVRVSACAAPDRRSILMIVTGPGGT